MKAVIDKETGTFTKEYADYLQSVINNLDDIIVVNGQEIARVPAKYRTVPYVADELTGVLNKNCDLNEVREEALRDKYGFSY